MPYGRDQMTAIARDLARRGFAVWNLEYRRLGTSTGGWPGTFDDATAGIGHLARLAAGGVDLDLDRVAVVGHSAGGHLALWSAARERREGPGGAAERVLIRAAVGLAPVADLVRAHELGLGGGAVAELLGGTPTGQAARYQAASPRAMLPLGVTQLVIHGVEDDVVPVEMARSYTRAARIAGDRVDLLELSGTGHMDFLDPASAAHAALCDFLRRALPDSDG
jgi:acetyl esterase/lipase